MNFNVPDADSAAQWEAAWKEFDPTTNKYLPVDDIRAILLGLGKEPTSKELANLCNQNNKCNYESFTRYMSSQPKQVAEPVEIRNAIKVLSLSCGGTLRTAELRLLLTSQGERFTHSEAAALVADSDPYSTGFVDVEAFTSRMTSSST